MTIYQIQMTDTEGLNPQVAFPLAFTDRLKALERGREWLKKYCTHVEIINSEKEQNAFETIKLSDGSRLVLDSIAVEE